MEGPDRPGGLGVWDVGTASRCCGAGQRRREVSRGGSRSNPDAERRWSRHPDRAQPPHCSPSDGRAGSKSSPAAMGVRGANLVGVAC